MLRRFPPLFALPGLVLSAVLAGALPRALAQSQLEQFETVTGQARVIEGDRMAVGGKTVRLYGIDAPELNQTCETRRGRTYNCGTVSREVLAQIVGSREMRCTLYAKLSGNIYTGRCFIGTADVGEMMIRRGWAFSYRGTSQRYEQAEAWAQSIHAGLWAGRARRPWVWRQEHPEEQPQRPPSSNRR